MLIHVKITTLSFAATEVASSKKNNPSNSLPIKVRSFAKKMDDASMYMIFISYIIEL